MLQIFRASHKNIMVNL